MVSCSTRLVPMLLIGCVPSNEVTQQLKRAVRSPVCGFFARGPASSLTWRPKHSGEECLDLGRCLLVGVGRCGDPLAALGCNDRRFSNRSWSCHGAVTFRIAGCAWLRCSVLKTRRSRNGLSRRLLGRSAAALFRVDDRWHLQRGRLPLPGRTLVAVHVGDDAGHQASGSASSINAGRHLIAPTTPDQPRPGDPSGLSARPRQSVWRCHAEPVVSTAAAGTACVFGDGDGSSPSGVSICGRFPCAGLGRRFFVGC